MADDLESLVGTLKSLEAGLDASEAHIKAVGDALEKAFGAERAKDLLDYQKTLEKEIATEQALAAAVQAGAAKRTAATDQAAASTKRLSDESKQAGGSSTSMWASMAQGGAAAISVFEKGWEATKKLAAALEAAATAAAQGEAHARALRSLGDAYRTVSDSTRGALSAEQALHAQQSLLQAGYEVTNRDLGVITRAAREYALATGSELPQALEQLSEALRNGEAGGLRRFGVSVDSSASKADTLRSAVEQLAHAQDGSAPSARTLGEAQEALGRTFDESKEHLALTAAETFHLQSAMEAAASALPAVASGIQSIGSVAAAAAAPVLALITAVQNLRREGAGATVATATSGNGGIFLGAHEITGTETARLAASRAANENSALEMASQGSGWGPTTSPLAGFGLTSAQSTAAAGLARTGRRAGGGGGGGGGPQYDEGAQRELQARIEELLQKARDAGAIVDGVVRAQNERLDAFGAREVQSMIEAFGDAAGTVIRHRGEALDAYVGRQMAAVQHAADELQRGQHLIEQRAKEERDRDEEERKAFEAETKAWAVAQNERERSFNQYLQHSQSVPDANASEEMTRRLQHGQTSVGDLDEQIKKLQAAATSSTSDAEVEKFRHRAEAIAHTRDAYLELVDAQQKVEDVGLQVGKAIEDGFKLHQSAAQTLGEGTTKIIGMVQGAYEQAFGAILDGAPLTAEATKKMFHDMLKEAALWAAWNSGLEFVRAIGDAASGNYPGAALHVAAGVGLAAIAGAAGVGAVATASPPSAATGGAGARGPAIASSSRPGAAGDGGTNIVNNFNGSYYGTTSELQDSVARGMVQYQRRQNWTPDPDVRF